MQRTARPLKAGRIALIGALCAVLLAGCGGVFEPVSSAPERGEKRAEAGRLPTIAAAEAAVTAAPQVAEHRARLGTAYLAAGRFASAAQSLGDARRLGDQTPHTLLRYALALVGSGRDDEAASLLFAQGEALPPADLGLALAMAGEPGAAVRILERAVREGQQSPALRQNLSLAYALAGRWREARLMAALDLPPEKVGGRMEWWAALAAARQPALRLAGVLRVPVGVRDEGLPVALALAPSEPVARGSGPERSEITAAAAEPTIRIVLPVFAPEPIRIVLPTFNGEAEPVA